jgi:hypothetical protein
LEAPSGASGFFLIVCPSVIIYPLKNCKIPLNPPEAVKKFKEWKIENPCHVPGREKFTPPKKALDSPLPAGN